MRHSEKAAEAFFNCVRHPGMHRPGLSEVAAAVEVIIPRIRLLGEGLNELAMAVGQIYDKLEQIDRKLSAR